MLKGKGKDSAPSHQKSGMGEICDPTDGDFLPRIIVQTQDATIANSPRPTAYHPEEARPVLWHMKFWVHCFQEPPEVFTLELGPKLLPLRHIPKGFLRKQNG